MLGGQVVVTVLSALFLRKLPLTFSQKWLFNNVKYYRCPTDQELRAAGGDKVVDLLSSSNGGANNKGGRRRGQNKKVSPNNSTYATYSAQHFSFPKWSPVELHLESTSDADVLSWKYWVELKWLMDYTSMTCFVLLLTFLYAYFLPQRAQKEFNLSVIWLIIGWCFTFHSLLKLVSAFFKTVQTNNAADQSEQSSGFVNHEAFICLSAACFNFLLTCFALILTPAHWFDFEFNSGCTKLVHNFDDFFFNLTNVSSVVEENSIEDDFVASRVARCRNANVFLLGCYSAVLGLILTFPFIRLARIHQKLINSPIKDLKQYEGVSIMAKVLSHMNVLLPLMLVVLWMRPVSYTSVEPYLQSIFPQNDPYLIWTYSICATILLTAIVKVLILPSYLKTYLLSLTDKTDSFICQAGTITNVHYQKIVASHNYYACVVCLQLIAPAALLFFQAAMLILSTPHFQSPNATSSPHQNFGSVTIPTKFVWKLIPASLCHNFIEAASFFFAIIHCLITGAGLLLNFSTV